MAFNRAMGGYGSVTQNAPKALVQEHLGLAGRRGGPRLGARMVGGFDEEEGGGGQAGRHVHSLSQSDTAWHCVAWCNAGMGHNGSVLCDVVRWLAASHNDRDGSAVTRASERPF
uniref:Uncharacterized protein n=1 Tax=Oryza meridionalis TaxID=40149 RepID=A0A0E0DNU5_9ORYZ